MVYSSLVELPEDIMLEILAHVSVVDLLSVKKTCRVLHALGSSDYLWHQIVPQLDLPLDIRNHNIGDPVSELSAAELQQVAMKAVQFDRNWQTSQPRIEHLTSLPYFNDAKYFDEMQLLPGGQWMVAAQRRRSRDQWQSSTCITVWSLEDTDDIYCTASFEIDGLYKYFAICQPRNTSKVSIAVTSARSGREILKTYSIPLENPFQSIHAQPTWRPQLTGTVLRESAHGIIHEVDVHESVVAATLVDFVDNMRRGRVLFYNTATAARTLVTPRLPESTIRLCVRVHSQHIVLICMLHTYVVIRVHELPCTMLEGKSLPSTPTPIVTDMLLGTDEQPDSLGVLVAEYRTSTLSGPHDFFVSEGAHERAGRSASLSLLAFRSFHDNRPSDAYMFTIPLPFDQYSTAIEFPGMYQQYLAARAFPTAGETSVDIVHVGHRGRSVWLERHWEIDEVRLMKLAALDGQPVASTLLPSSPNLPFAPRSCQSVAFDEVTGRLCLNIHTGGLYILDF